MNLRFYHDARTVKNLAVKGKEFVKICNGQKRGSVGKIIAVRHKNFNNNEFQLEINGCKPFWIKGEHLQWLPGHTGDTILVDATDPPEVFDMMGKSISNNAVIVFNKVIDPNTTTSVDLVVGTVRSIEMNGCIRVKPIVNSGESTCKQDVMLRNNKCLVIDKELIDSLVIYKLRS
jgi:hypothetical protein